MRPEPLLSQSTTELGTLIWAVEDQRFVDEELVIASTPASPVLTLPSREGKSKHNSSSSTSLSHSVDSSGHSHNHHQHNSKSKHKEELEDSHLHLSSGSSDLDSDSGHIHIHDSPEKEDQHEGASTSYNNNNNNNNNNYNEYPPRGNWGYNYDFNYPGDNNPYPSYSYPYPSPFPSNPNPNMYYMKKSATPAKTVVYEDPTVNGYSSYYGNAGYFGYPMMASPPREPSPQRPPPVPPSPPRVSTWDFLNVFETLDNDAVGGYQSAYYSAGRYGYGSTTSSPDSKEVREREGIPDLEDETEEQVIKQVDKEKKRVKEEMNANRGSKFHEEEVSENYGEGTSKSKSVPVQISSESIIKGKEIKTSTSPDTFRSPDSILSTKSPDEDSVRKRVSFEVEETSTTMEDVESSSKPSSLTTLSAHGTRDLQEVVMEIRDEFETASSYGKEVASLLEVGKLPYQRRTTLLRVILSRILYLVSSHPPTRPSVQISSKTMKIAKAYSGEPGNHFDMRSKNLSATLEKLYAWEKKLYKEVKDEERLRITYEKQCKRLKTLDEHGAESSKIDATQASIRKLLTKINVTIRAVDAISSKIHRLRDEELQPQITELIHGLIRMWKSMLRCHQKQFQALMESKVRSLRANTGLRRDSSLRATLVLETELINWCNCFNKWVNTQKSYVESLNEWLLRCLLIEPEETADGIAPFSPSRMGAPPIFVLCNDWYQAMVTISEKGVENAMLEFASSLHKLWERQDEEQRQRTKAEYLTKDFEKRLRTLRMERGRIEHEQNALSDKSMSKAPSGNGVSPLDDLQVDLDSMRKKLEEERGRHKEAAKLVHDAASGSLQAGLVPIFEALGNFTSEVLKAHEEVRLETARGS
ncbi:protein ALTERED PHOSPHATE STARVATION RESPONSE 1 isoform X2 [Ricinus communis]|uniref:protein ALTERED PHOSPHATE STARVATION RESPONSE 1 isoform X2 n=1 Tax=Ricinus communis TaxID=3988 RepID=UPI00201A6E01|nr:protein ALTERED PHOSPHATE STARVATION RESPONSE 1 isoform X2 [Ricinus communis]XP_048226485.1 protein ALTERED PHOSPHATE STARVATION RESPONSE 1 isoform X2 [Ricinus communis]